ncbi:MAG: signal peptidase II [Chloroflexi bacterium]|jgi:signal peptidase II|nr:MAG: signal peptidase II [Chloroflexota bacterium]
MQLPDNQHSKPCSTTDNEKKPTDSNTETMLRILGWRSDLLLATLIFVVFLIDQATKSWVRNSLIEGRSFPTDGFFRITHVSNTGSAFGFFPNQTLFLLIASVIGIGVLLLFFRKQAGRDWLIRTSLGLQLGGATGNLVDRITMGKVTDFLDVGPWPVFNLADVSIVSGIIILAWLLYRSPVEIPSEDSEPNSIEELNDESAQKAHKH